MRCMHAHVVHVHVHVRVTQKNELLIDPDTADEHVLAVAKMHGCTRVHDVRIRGYMHANTYANVCVCMRIIASKRINFHAHMQIYMHAHDFLARH